MKCKRRKLATTLKAVKDRFRKLNNKNAVECERWKARYACLAVQYRSCPLTCMEYEVANVNAAGPRDL